MGVGQLGVKGTLSVSNGNARRARQTVCPGLSLPLGRPGSSGSLPPGAGRGAWEADWDPAARGSTPTTRRRERTWPVNVQTLYPAPQGRVK